MGGTLTEPASLLEQSFQRLPILAVREILKPARIEDCLNNARSGEKRYGIYGPDTEIKLFFRGEAVYVRACNIHQGSGELMSLTEISGPVMLCTIRFKTNLKTAH